MRTSTFYVISFLTNATILVFEITGGRLLAPYLGTSVGVWAGLIAVVLGGMALGYHFGGRMGDTHASRERISFVLFLASLTAFLAWGLRDVLPSWIIGQDVSVVVGAVVVGTLLFVPTVILLAAVSPLLAKNLLSSLSTSAKVVGELNAVGTIGSIVGALATGLFLIPYFGVGDIMLGVAILIMVLAYVLSKKDVGTRIGVTAVVLACALSLNALPTRAGSIVADVSTAYNRIFITREHNGEDTLALWTSPFGIQCEMYVDENGNVDESRLVSEYLKAHDIVIASLFPKGPSKALFLGGCVEAFPRYLLGTYPTMTADVVEIDPGMIDVAETYFGFDASLHPTLTTIFEDARTFVNKNHEPYDVVYMDAFGSAGRAPFQLMTEEMFARVSLHLSERGVLLMNIHGAYEAGSALYPSVYVKTVQTAFPYVGLYQFTGAPRTPQNLVILASKTRELPSSLSDARYPGFLLERVYTDTNVITLTDNYAPVEGVFRNKLIRTPL